MNLKPEMLTLPLGRWRHWIFLNVLLMIGFTFAGNEVQTSSTDTVPDFTLKDANQNDFRLSEHLGQIMVLSFIPDTKNKTQGTRWLNNSRACLQQLKRKFAERITVLGLKEMTDLPLFVPKSFIRIKLRKEPFPYLIDWEGKVFAQFAVQRTPVLMVVDSGGKIVYRQELTADTDRFNALCAQIEALIDRQQRSEQKAASRKEDNE